MLDRVEPKSEIARRTGGQILVDCLIANGTNTVFTVPGESFLAVLDALHDVPDKVKVIVGRHEASTANMAEAYGKLTGRPGICFVTRGPGASQASVAVHTAAQDSTPLILFIGQVSREQLGREAFQEMDFREFFGGAAKWVTEITDASRVPELLTRAFHVAVNGRPGPVVISIPEDMQTDTCVVPTPSHFKHALSAPPPAALADIQSMLEQAERPVVILGGGGWSDEACRHIQSFAESFSLPVVAGFRRQDLFDNTHPNYAGFLGFGVDPALVELIGEADVLLVLGERLGDTTTSGYSLLEFPRTRQKLIHIHPGAEELGILYQGDLLINATMRDSAAELVKLRPSRKLERAEWILRGHSNFERMSTPRSSNLEINVGEIVKHLREVLPAEATVSNGAGTYTGFVHKFYRYRKYGSQLAPTSGAMGYGLPAALAAKVAYPDQPAICFAGDGDFVMASAEFATAIQHDLPIIVIVIDNGSYGSIRVHQERRYPGRVYATNLINPDFVALAQAYGAHAERILATDDFPAAFERATASGRPALIHVKLDIEQLLAHNPRSQR